MSQLYEITGCISHIKPVQTFPSGFQKQEVVINDKDPKYPQEVAIQFTRDMVNKLAEYHEGEHVCVKFAIQGHEFNGKHYNDLKAIKIERAKKLGGESYVATVPSPKPPEPTAMPPAYVSQQQIPVNPQFDNDLPF